MKVVVNTKHSPDVIRRIAREVLKTIRADEGKPRFMARHLEVVVNPGRARVTSESWAQQIIVRLPKQARVDQLAYHLAWCMYVGWYKRSRESADRAAEAIRKPLSQVRIPLVESKKKAVDKEAKARAALTRAAEKVATLEAQLKRAKQHFAKKKKSVDYYDRKKEKRLHGDPAKLSKSEFEKRMRGLRGNRG